MQEDFRLLLLADTTLDRKQLERLLSKYAPHICLYEQSFFEKNSDVSFHGALVDYTFSTASGLPLWQHFQERQSVHPFDFAYGRDPLAAASHRRRHYRFCS